MVFVKTACMAGFVLCAVVTTASADDLTRRIQQDLVALGYDPGNVGGEVTTE